MNQIVEFEWRTETDETFGVWKRERVATAILPLTVADITPLFSTSLSGGNYYHLDIKFKLYSKDFVEQVLEVPDTVEEEEEDGEEEEEEEDGEEEDGKKKKSIHGMF